MVPVLWSADGLIHYSFLNASETMTFEKYSQQINEMHQNLQCLWQWSTERAQFFSTTPDCTSHNQCFKSWTNWAMKFCLICYIHLTSRQLTATSGILTACKMILQPAGCRKCFPRVCQIPKHEFLCYRNKQSYFSLVKMCWKVIVPIMINKDMCCCCC